jgi:hypothetical protein
MTEASGRTCGSCTACCKTHTVEDPAKNFFKPMGKWCEHCTPGTGCGIYENRPPACVAFHCAWLLGFGKEEDRPDRRKVVMDHVSLPNLPEEGLMQLWEVVPGAMQSPYAKRMTRASLETGIITTHIYLSGRKKIFLPVKYLDRLDDLNIEEGFEFGSYEELLR